ncbi:MAG: beta-galactosidase [Dysgonamonadaceae bacterium]|jgi:beta-galactosidase|nr:beta-galactosidase [Dysgonamonadaceae bacterium]
MKTQFFKKGVFIGAIFGIIVDLSAQKIVFDRDFSPQEGRVVPQEFPYRKEICLNGLWDFQPVDVPTSWKRGSGIAPDLSGPVPDKWEEVKIKIPSPVNVNNWGNGFNTGEGTDKPYAPGTIYFPSYPESWVHTQMGWLKRNFLVPADWNGKRVILHFEAVAGDCAVYVNGKEVCRNFDSYLPFEADITDCIDYKGSNELLVGVRHSKLFDRSHPVYAKMGATYPPGSTMDNLIGIYQDVFLWSVPEIRITDVFVQPYLDENRLDFDIEIINLSKKTQTISMEGDIREWISRVGEGILDAPEINWKLGNSIMNIQGGQAVIASGETKKIRLTQTINNQLKEWSPAAPNLYTLLLSVKNGENTCDSKASRFGWRQFKIVGDHFELNGKPVQCFGDIQHPFSAYICSRRFAYAWYRMIKDFGGNCVRPHAQPWPRLYYDLADEMGLMVLDETALFGSSIRLNFEENLTWERSHQHLERLIKRDRNHPSVVGWSAGNELFAIALLNKPPQEISDKWDEKMVELALSAKTIDPTRDFITLDGDRDMNGQLPVWSKHFGHGLQLNDLPDNLNKPLVVGESGATYYGRPIQLYPFVGEKAFESYTGRNEALAIDAYQNAVFMARPYLSYFSPSEVCWFGLEHLNLGYNDFSRLPVLSDGIFAGKPYEEGKPGYQYERIPPYVTTFNPGLDPALPLYKPLPMFWALKAALSGSEPQPSPWDTYVEVRAPAKNAFPPALYKEAVLIGRSGALLTAHLERTGIICNPSFSSGNWAIIDAENVSSGDLERADKVIEKIKEAGGIIWAMGTGKPFSDAFRRWLPVSVEQTSRQATALEYNPQNEWGRYFQLPDLYFAEMDGDRKVQKSGLSGELVKKGAIVLKASRTDWGLFNNNPEEWKCAQVVLYEALEKPEGAAMITYPLGKAVLILSVIDYSLDTKEMREFWKLLYSVMGIDYSYDPKEKVREKVKSGHDLLMDGPVE